MTFNDLKKYFDSKNNIERYDFKLRIYRAISWGQAADNEKRLDDKIIKLWISFNALYGSGFTKFSEVSSFLESVIKLDKKNMLKESLLLKQINIKSFISIPELYDVYWEDENKSRAEREDKAKYLIERKKVKFNEFIMSGNGADAILFDLFELIYLLRNQIFHGSSSYDSLENLPSKQKCIEILELFIPKIIEIMIDNPDNNWHEVKYKPIRNEAFKPETKEEKDLAIKASNWLKKVDSDGEYKTPPLSKEKRHILYKMLESKGIYKYEKYYPSNDTIGLIIKKKNNK